MRKFLCLFLIFTLLSGSCFGSTALQVDTDVSAEIVTAPSAILMEQSSGQVLYELNADEKMHIASVTKTMTLLLIMEALANGKIKYTDTVTTSEYAASMGGSQVFLETGEQMSVEDMVKAIAVASGNDASVAMAEFISGTESAFVEKMNEKAIDLGAKNTHFINCNGLDETEEHYSTARDVALISCELLKYPDITKFTTIWMDSLRNGEFGLSNTNKLIRFYDGATGLKTGSTSVAKYCLSASAKRNNMELVAVVLGAPTTKDRFNSASRLLDYGFANYSIVSAETLDLTFPEIPVVGGKVESVGVSAPDLNFIVKKGNQDKIQYEIILPEKLSAPLKKGEEIGEIIFTLDGQELARRKLITGDDVPRIGFSSLFLKMFKLWCT